MILLGVGLAQAAFWKENGMKNNRLKRCIDAGLKWLLRTLNSFAVPKIYSQGGCIWRYRGAYLG